MRQKRYRSIVVYVEYVPFSVVAIVWYGEHLAFVMEKYMRNGGWFYDIITTQLALRIRFERGLRDFVPELYLNSSDASHFPASLQARRLFLSAEPVALMFYT